MAMYTVLHSMEDIIYQFAYAGPTTWSSPPDDIKNSNLTLSTFNHYLKTLVSFYSHKQHI